MITKAVIPAAGLGTRFLPATKALPKEMLPIVDTPTIQYIVEEAVASGITNILIITGRGKRAIEDHFDKSYELESELERTGKKELLKLTRDISNLVDIHYIRQKEARGLGHAIHCAKTFIGNEPFAVMLGDDVVVSQTKPAIRQLMDVYDQVGSSIVGVKHVPKKDVNKYGIVSPKGDFLKNGAIRAEQLVEKPSPDKAPSNIAIMGRYIITPDIFYHLERQETGAGGEIQLTDALNKMAALSGVYAYEFEGDRYDVGDKLGFLKATVEFALERSDLEEDFRKYLQGLAKDGFQIKHGEERR